MDTNDRIERGCGVIALLLGLQLALALPAYAQETHAFNVPATSPALAIQAFGQQSRLQIVAAAQALDGKQLNPVTGELTTDAAFQALLAGTGLVPKYVEGRSVAIVSRDAAAAPATRQEGEAGDPGLFRVAETSAGGAAAVAAGTAGAPREAAALEEVVVTAQKRAERLQDVPVAVTAVSGGALESIHATSLADYAAYIPSLQVISFLGQPGQVNLALRGVTTGSTAANQTVATYVDDVPVGSSSIYAGGGSSGIDVLPYDVERIEVLEGPQGTLYGASALGGILKYVTREPDLREAQFRVGLDLATMTNATRAGYGARASASLPLVADQLGLSLSVSHGYTPGYLDDVATGKRSFNSGIQDAARAALLWAPTARLSLELSALYNRSPFNGTGAVSVGSAPGQPPLGRYDNTDVEPDSNNVTTQLYMARLRYDLGWGSLTSVSSYSRMASLSEADGSSIFYPFFGDYAAFTTRSDVKKYTQELRLASPAQQSLEWVAGAFYTREDATAGQTGRALVPATNQPDPALDPLIVTDEPSHFREAAVFGNATYRLTPAWDLSAGLRVSRNQQSVRESAYGSLFGTTQDTAEVTPFPDVTQNKTTWSVSSSYHLTPDQMLYARVATGYRPGGANKIAPDAPPTFGPDTTTNYEVGFKSEWLERRLLLNLTVFYIDWRNTQVTGVTPLYLTYLSNAGAAVSKGAELATRYTPLHGLTLGLNATYTNAYLTVDAPALGGLAGDPLPSTPKLAGSLTVDYEFPLAAGLRGLLNAAARFEGARNTAFPSDPGVSGNYPLSSYATLDLSAGVLREAWSARLYVRNATNRYAYLFVIPPGGDGAPSTNVILQPRSVGLSLDVRF
ncbi:MAG: TonB-dependent receptor [Proteobacteria bacterium]|nr:TonB-dependent receptor [Pseudomonadota bacterium]